MKYEMPTLRRVGTAIALVLGSGTGDPDNIGFTDERMPVDISAGFDE